MENLVKTETETETETETVSRASAESVFLPANFEHAQRVASMLCTSTMIPEIFRGKGNVGNCMIALNLASRLQADPMMVMQKMYIIKGKPAIEAQLQIALFQRAGNFEALDYHFDDKDGGGCYCSAKNVKTGKTVVGTRVTADMAKAEGWTGKWKNILELMLRYRSATFFISQHDPASRMGMMEQSEAIDAAPKQADYKQVPSIDHAREATDIMTLAFEKARNEKALIEALEKSKKDRAEFGDYVDEVRQAYMVAVERITKAINVKEESQEEQEAQEPNFSDEISADELP